MLVKLTQLKMGKKNKNNKKAKTKSDMTKTQQYKPAPSKAYNTKKTDKTKDTKKIEKNIKKKPEKKNKKKHPKLRLIFKIILILFVLMILIGGGILAGILSGYFGDDFKLTEDELKVSSLNTEIYDRNGTLIATLNGDESREWIDIGDMPEYLPTAFVSIEDERFYDHPGFDVKRTLAATVKYVLSKVGIGNSSYGGSTITQQLVKNLTKEDEREALRKIKEIARAYNLEKTLSKQQILELYLNLIYVGGQCYGVEMGSQYYFSKSARELSLAECAFLAGINNSPNIYEPFSEDEKEINFIKNRVKTVLGKMKELGKIKTEEDYTNAIAQVDNGLPFKKGGAAPNIYSYHTDAVIDQILAQIAEENPDWSDVRVKQYLYGGGLRIYTTQDTGIQHILEEEVKQEKYQKPSQEREGEVTQTAMVILDHKTGQVVATVGGTGEKNTSRGFNFATMQPRQTGSSMKPLSVIAPAVQNGLITAGTVYDDVLTKIPGQRYGWPVNYDGVYPGLSTVRYEIQVSHNIVPVRILYEMGIDKSVEYLQNSGISTLVEKDYALAPLALGGLTNGVTALEMAGAYGAIANDGLYITPTFYTRVENTNGEVVLEPKQERRRILSEENAYVVKSILTQPVLSGTATFCKIPGIETCAKTGSTDDYYDRWLCGFTPYYTGATWFGYRKNERIRGFSQNPAGTIWASTMKKVHADLPNANFEKPANITYATICKDSGLIATDVCRNDPRGGRVYTEVFAKGTAPSKYCNCHVRLRVCGTEDNYKLENEGCPDAKEIVFITRKNSESDTSWKKAGDAKYMAPTEVCTVHKKPTPKPTATPKKENTNTNTTKTNTVNTNTKNTVSNTVTNTTKPTNSSTTPKPEATPEGNTTSKNVVTNTTKKLETQNINLNQLL